MPANTVAPNGVSGATYTSAARQSFAKQTMRGGIDEETLEVRAVEGSLANATGPKEPVDGSNIVDAPILPGLWDQIMADEQIGSVTADGAYDKRKFNEEIATRGATAVIPPRKNAKPGKPTSPNTVARNEALRASKYPCRAIWRRWSGYRRRSRSESKMSCIKLLGQSPMARDFDRQFVELQVRIAVLNGYSAFGIPVTVAVE
jgi:Transposase DDE domain